MNGSNVTSDFVDVFAVEYPQPTYGILFMALSIILTIWIIINNIILLLVLIKYEALHTDTNVIIGSLSTIDLGMSSTHFLLLIYYIWTPWKIYHAYVLCLATAVTMLFFTSASVNIFLCALIDRYLKICHPFLYQRVMTKKIAVAMVMVALATALGVSLPLLYKDRWHPEASCGFSNLVNHTVRRMFLVYCIGIFFAVSFFTIRIFVAIRKQQKRILVTNHSIGQATKENIDRAKALAIMMLFLFITYSPYVMVLAAMAIANGDFVTQDWFVYLEKLTMKMCLLNNIGNPVMYGWKDKQIKRYVKKMLCKKSVNEKETQPARIKERQVTVVNHI